MRRIDRTTGMHGLPSMCHQGLTNMHLRTPGLIVKNIAGALTVGQLKGAIEYLIP